MAFEADDNVITWHPRRVRAHAAARVRKRFVATAPVWADEIETERYPGWLCALIIIGLAMGVWAMLAGFIALMTLRLG